MAAGNKKITPRIDLNPSSADRWTTCTASPKFIFENWDKLPPHDTFFNQEGTSAHEVAAAALEGREINLAECPVPVDEDMLLHGWGYAEYVGSFIRPGSTLIVEQKIPLWYMESRNSRVDAVVDSPDALDVFDYKYGEGIIVDPEQNLQGIIYAKSYAHTKVTSPKKVVRIHIYQPRSRDAGEYPYRVWETTYGEINQIAKTIKGTAEVIQAFKPGGYEGLEFVPSKKACQWCPAKGFCDARRQEFTREVEVLATIEPGPKHLPPANTLSLQQRVAVEQHGDDIIKWIKDVQGDNLRVMQEGTKLEGFKLVQSRGGNRYWSNPQVAAKMLLSSTILREDEVYKKTVIGPAEAEKKLGKHKFDAQITNLVAKPPGVPVIAPASDKREELGSVANDFEAIEDLTVEDI